MSDFVNASDDVLADRNQLADQVCRELQLAGIPAFLMADAAGSVGAEVEVDAGDDEAGGVFVTWRPDPALSRAVAESVRNRELSAPVIRHSGAIVSHMRDAIIGILSSAGFRAGVADDDMRPMVIHVAG
ncbi:hypothetical protein ABZ646_37595 [Streptomyces sp. NPDC007162]|uniref:hypothetical protein n=1 Tax=Streptomyces sp. NPDC007162 TaxID=3156917 RepID=UPI003409EA16